MVAGVKSEKRRALRGLHRKSIKLRCQAEFKLPLPLPLPCHVAAQSVAAVAVAVVAAAAAAAGRWQSLQHKTNIGERYPHSSSRAS